MATTRTTVSMRQYNVCLYIYLCTCVCLYVYILPRHAIRICVVKFLKKTRTFTAGIITDFLFFCLLLYHRNMYTRVTKRDVQIYAAAHVEIK